MKYQALYRKYRPKTFNDVCGQQIIVQTLKNVIKNNKLTHAYLFIGPRGTGKTSIAKIFAKTINCLNPESGISCEKCEICKNNNQNENIDIIEMDAASNNGVDEIREIKNNVTLLPTISKYKIYIIDEVHMLTTGAFNALLKTLEEPPEHVIFILATTEPHKIPLTIMSRCQSFEFKPIPISIITDRLKYICDQEGIKATDEALNLIGEESNGGLRDAVSMLDQLNAYTDGNIKYDDVLMINGRISNSEIYEFINNIKNEKYDAIFDKIQEWQLNGKNYIYVSEDIIKYLRKELIEYKINQNSEIINILSEDDILDIIMIINKSIDDMKLSNDKRIIFDVTIINIINKLNNKQMFNKNVTTKIQTSNEKSNQENKKIINKEIQSRNYDDYDNLMSIRLNNILGNADRPSKEKYNKIIRNLSEDISDLEKLKIINLLSDTELKAASKNGVIFTTKNDNILHDLYDNIELIENYISENKNNMIKICVLDNLLWEEKRKIYVNKIKNKEIINFIDESDVLSKINLSKKEVKGEFDELLEIGGE